MSVHEEEEIKRAIALLIDRCRHYDENTLTNSSLAAVQIFDIYIRDQNYLTDNDTPL
jgi:hypothetical protein